MTNVPVIRRVVATGLLLAVVAFAGACSKKDEPTAAEANANLCKEKSDLAATVQSFGSLDPGATTVDKLHTLREDVSQAVDELNDAAIGVGESEIKDLRDAKDEFLKSIQGVDDVASLRAAAPQIKTSAAAVRSAFQAVFASADCT